MKILLTLILAVFTSISIGQSGYLGSKTNFQINMNNSVNPFTVKGKQVNENQYKETRINLNTSYSFTLNRVMNDNIQLGIGYRFANMALYSTDIWTDIQDPVNPNIHSEVKAKILNKLKVKHHSGIINLRYFTNGISPIGKGIGIDFELGRTSIERLDVDYATGYELTSSGSSSGFLSELLSDFLPFNINSKKRYTLNQLNQDNVDSTTTLKASSIVNSFIFKAYIGRTIPLTKKIGVDLSFTFPLLRVLRYNNTTKIGMMISQKGQTLQERGNATDAIAYSIAQYNGLSINIGLKYFL